MQFHGAQLRAGHSLIDIVDANGSLGRQGGNIPDQLAPNMDHFCLRIEPWNANVIEEHLKRHGIPVDAIENRYGAAGMGPSIYLQDPEGNTVELKGMGRE